MPDPTIAKSAKLLVLVILFLFFAGVNATAQENSRSDAIRLCEDLFGPRVNYSPVLFEIDRFYVLNIKFDSRGQLEEVAVEPKYYHVKDRPEWEEPEDFRNLSAEQVSDLLSKIDKLKPLGALVKQYEGVIIVTNKTGPYTDEYKNASVTFGKVVDRSLPEDSPTLVRYISVRYTKEP